MIENKIKILEQKTKEIRSATDRILMDIEDFEGYDELFVIEHNFDFIRRNAEEAVDCARNAYDDLEEE